MKALSTLTALALAAAATAAQARDIELGTLPEVVAPAFHSQTIAGSAEGQGILFQDNWLFTLTKTSTFAVSIANFVPDGSSATDVGATLALFLGNGATFNISDTDPTDGLRLDATLNPGKYAVAVVGQTTGALGGAYAGAMAASVSSVPEPASALSLAAGLAALAWLGRRRFKQ